MAEFLDKKSGLSVVFTKAVIAELLANKQNNGMCEAGGMLFCSDLFSERLVISKISRPHVKDIRRKFFFRQNKKYAQRIIDEFFKEGFHYVGDWHTHPQPHPKPSGKDIKTIKEVFNKSDHGLSYMVHVIVASVDHFEQSYVSLTDGKDVFLCVPVFE